jgi:adenine phosphoribosyltransferase
MSVYSVDIAPGVGFIPFLNLKGLIREVPDYPKPGIPFKDITPLLADPLAFGAMVHYLAFDEKVTKRATKVVGLEARGFIFGAALAQSLGIGFIPIRKKGKLPYKRKTLSYDLEYGSDTIEIHEDALSKDDYVLIVDDLLATGGTAEAAIKLVKSLGCHIEGVNFAIELSYLGGRKRLEALEVPVRSVLTYE